jgi:hypothetical protein
MKNILIAATLAGIAGAAAFLYLRNRGQRTEQPESSLDPNDHHRNLLGRMMRHLKKSNGVPSVK